MDKYILYLKQCLITHQNMGMDEMAKVHTLWSLNKNEDSMVTHHTKWANKIIDEINRVKIAIFDQRNPNS